MVRQHHQLREQDFEKIVGGNDSESCSVMSNSLPPRGLYSSWNSPEYWRFACNVGNLGSVPGLGRSSGEGKGYPLQYSGLENSMDCTVYGVAKSQTPLSDFHFHFLGDSGGQRSLACCSPQGHQQLDMSQALNNSAGLIK